MADLDDLIADIEAEMAGVARGFANRRGELLFQAASALTTLRDAMGREKLARVLGAVDGVSWDGKTVFRGPVHDCADSLPQRYYRLAQAIRVSALGEE